MPQVPPIVGTPDQIDVFKIGTSTHRVQINPALMAMIQSLTERVNQVAASQSSTSKGAASPSIVTGQVPLSQGVANGSVSNLGLPSAPRAITAWVSGPDPGLAITAHITAGSATTNGFLYNLSAQPDSDGYYLSYIAVL